MRRTRFDDAPCPIARTTDVMGDWWTPMVMREAFYGAGRFEEFQERLGVSRATLTQRLTRLVDEDFLTRVEYQPNPSRYEYRLTDKGRAFFNVLAAMWRFGEDWLFDPDNPLPVTLAQRTPASTSTPWSSTKTPANKSTSAACASAGSVPNLAELGVDEVFV